MINFLNGHAQNAILKIQRCEMNNKQNKNGYFLYETDLIPKESNKSWKNRRKTHNGQAKHFYKNHYRNLKVQ